MEDYCPQVRRTDVVLLRTGDELLVYDTRAHKAACLNETSASIWNLCNGERSVSDIKEKIGGRQLISNRVFWLALNQFRKNELLEGNEKHESFQKISGERHNGASKSSVELPRVSSISAPGATNLKS